MNLLQKDKFLISHISRWLGYTVRIHPHKTHYATHVIEFSFHGYEALEKNQLRQMERV